MKVEADWTGFGPNVGKDILLKSPSQRFINGNVQQRIDAIDILKDRHARNPTSRTSNALQKARDDLLDFQKQFGFERADLGELLMASGLHLRSDNSGRLDYALGRIDDKHPHSNEVSYNSRDFPLMAPPIRINLGSFHHAAQSF